MTVFPALFQISTGEISTLLYTYSLKRAPVSGEASPYSSLGSASPGENVLQTWVLSYMKIKQYSSNAISLPVPQVTYNCVPGSGLFGSVVQVCEGQSQNIQCAHPKRIKILSANYGRLPGGPSCGGPIATSHCGADYSLIEVKVDCQGASSCTLVASNSQFGDPCFGTRKYLEVSTFHCP